MDRAEELQRSAAGQLQSDLDACLTLVSTLKEEKQRLRRGLEQVLQSEPVSQHKSQSAVVQSPTEQSKRSVLKKIFKTKKVSTPSAETGELAENRKLSTPSVEVSPVSSESSCQRCELQAQEHRQIMSEMEVFYKDKLSESRLALKEKEEQLRSFKDRMAQSMVLSTSLTQSCLTEMYQQLRVCTWPNLQLTCSEAQARTLVQEMFRTAAENMRRATETVYGGQASSPKVEKFRQTAQENLQLALYHSSKQDVFKAAFPNFDAGPAALASECYWLGCLMALNSPPLFPHWDRADEGSVFPIDIFRQT